MSMYRCSDHLSRAGKLFQLVIFSEYRYVSCAKKCAIHFHGCLRFLVHGVHGQAEPVDTVDTMFRPVPTETRDYSVVAV